MEKLVYVLWKQPELPEAALRAQLLGPVAKRLRELGAQRLAVNVVDEDVAHAATVHMTQVEPALTAMLSFWLESADAHSPHEAVLAEVAARRAGYLVAESVALANPERVAAGERTPGVNVVAFLERPSWIGWGDWLTAWLDEHRSVALETQSSHAYVRNVVVRRLSPDAPAWSGIVEEGFAADTVTDLMRWYRAEGSPERFEKNLERMLESCQRFLDLERVERHPMSEYRLED